MAAMMPFLAFVGPGSNSEQDRQLVRRHVMLGKNKGKRRKKKQNICAKPDAEDSHECQAAAISPKVGTDWSFIEWADTVELSLIGDVLKFSAHTKDIVSPLHTCITHDKKLKARNWFEPLSFDALHLNTIVFAIQAWFAAASNVKIDIRASVHHIRAIGLLRQRLDDEIAISDSTVNAVVALGAQAFMIGEEQTAREHLVGLKKIVELRGGLGAFREHPKLVIEMLRLDTSLAMHTSSSTLLCTPDSVGLQYPLPALADTDQPCPDLDNDLTEIWLALKRFSDLINEAAISNLKLPEEVILDTMRSTMYRLLSIQFECGSLDEVLRLTLLAFCSYIFLPWQGVKLPYRGFRDAWMGALQAVEGGKMVMPRLWSWLLMVGTITVGGDQCLRSSLLESIFELGLPSWTEMHKHLRGILWIDIVFDKPGERLYNKLTAS